MYKRQLFYRFPQILTYDVILASKMTLFWPFSPKMTYFDQIYAIIDIFDQFSVHKPDWNNKWRHMSKFGESGQIMFL